MPQSGPGPDERYGTTRLVGPRLRARSGSVGEITEVPTVVVSVSVEVSELVQRAEGEIDSIWHRHPAPFLESRTHSRPQIRSQSGRWCRGARGPRTWHRAWLPTVASIPRCR
jgi:hypothetical protein